MLIMLSDRALEHEDLVSIERRVAVVRHGRRRRRDRRRARLLPVGAQDTLAPGAMITWLDVTSAV